jgi:hypothetical protein
MMVRRVGVLCAFLPRIYFQFWMDLSVCNACQYLYSIVDFVAKIAPLLVPVSL